MVIVILWIIAVLFLCCVIFTYYWQRYRFLKRLSKWKGRFFIHSGWGIRANKPDSEYWGHYDMYCPITAVYQDMTGKYVSPSRALEVADKVGISTLLAKRIIQAADSGWSGGIRKKMLKTLELKELDA